MSLVDGITSIHKCCGLYLTKIYEIDTDSVINTIKLDKPEDYKLQLQKWLENRRGVELQEAENSFIRIDDNKIENLLYTLKWFFETTILDYISSSSDLWD